MGGDPPENDRHAGGDPGRQVQLPRRIIPHLLDASPGKSRKGACKSAGCQDYRIGHRCVKHGVRNLSQSSRRSGLVERDSRHDTCCHGGDKTFQKVGAVSGDIIDIITYKVSDRIRDPAVIFRQVMPDLSQDVRRNIRRLGIVAPRHAVEHRYDRTPEGIGDDPHDRRIAGKGYQNTVRDRVM